MERPAAVSPTLAGSLMIAVAFVTAVATHYIDRANLLTLVALPDRQEMVRASRWLDEYYAAAEGLQREGGLGREGHLDFDALAAWLFDVYLKARITRASEEEARAAVMRAIQSTDEWRAKHPGAVSNAEAAQGRGLPR